MSVKKLPDPQSSQDIDFYRDFVEMHPYPILRLGKKGEILYANSASLPILLEWGAEVGEKVIPEALKILDQIFSESNLAHKLEVQHGSQIIELTFSASSQGDFINVFGQDVTIQKKIEEDLIEATQKADAATKAKAEFLANMSHEIRTPMNGVIGMCDLLLTTVSDPNQKDQLKIIHNCGKSLMNIINDILDYSKLEADKVELEKEPFHLHQTAQEVVQLMSTKASEKSIFLSYISDSNTPPWYLGDHTKVRQILTNLINNAIKFTENGSIIVHSRLLKKVSENCEILFSVRDTGVGIPQESHSKLFHSFSQADISTTRKFGGTGLGLAISKGLCKKMGGDIWFESEKGKGSTFYFTLLLSETHSTENNQENSHSKIDSSFGKCNPLNILVAEDNRINQLVAVGFLEKLGYHPDIATNGIEVLDHLKRKHYDLILMDYHMPEMDGLEATRQICRIFSNPSDRPYIVALTASAMKSDVDQCLAAGMNDFLSKPIQMNHVIRVLNFIITTFHKAS